LAEITLFWSATLEGVQMGRLPKDTDRSPVLIAVYRAMKGIGVPQYLWEMWDTMLPVLSREEYPVREKIIGLVLEKKLEKHLVLELGKIRELLEGKNNMSAKQYSIESQVRMQVGKKLFEKALEWNISTDNELWKEYGAEVIKL
jgi:hypothetical protein